MRVFKETTGELRQSDTLEFDSSCPVFLLERQQELHRVSLVAGTCRDTATISYFVLIEDVPDATALRDEHWDPQKWGQWWAVECAVSRKSSNLKRKQPPSPFGRRFSRPVQ